MCARHPAKGFLQRLTLFVPAPPWNGCCNCSHFTDGNTEAQDINLLIRVSIARFTSLDLAYYLPHPPYLRAVAWPGGQSCHVFSVSLWTYPFMLRDPQRWLRGGREGDAAVSIDKDADTGDRIPAFSPPGHSSSPTVIILGIAVLCDLPRSLDLSEHRGGDRG